MESSYSLPDKSSPSLILTHPTDAERRRTWSLTHTLWGPALSLDGYVNREIYLNTVPLAKDGGLTQWILTDATFPPDERPILSSCETLRKRALRTFVSGDRQKSEDGHAVGDSDMGGDGGRVTVVDGIAYGIGAVFTEPRYRGRGYANRMMCELGLRLRGFHRRRESHGHYRNGIDLTSETSTTNEANGVNGVMTTRRPSEEPQEQEVLFSVLYSDIGKIFYAKAGWPAFQSTHVAFPPLAATASPLLPPSPPLPPQQQNGHSPTRPLSPTATPLGYHELAPLCHDDSLLLRSRLINISKTTKKPAVALLPDLDQLLWHLMREDYMTKHIFGRTPTVRGAIYGDIPGRRIWAVWTRAYYGGLEKTEGNTLWFLRVVVEPGLEAEAEEHQIGKEELVEGFKSILRIAQAEAAEWRLQEVQIWNPTGGLKRAIERSGVTCEFVEREKESIPSLMWYGDGEGGREGLEWVCNEKYGWC